MAPIRISELPEIATVTNDDVFVINDGGTETRKITYSNLTAGLVPNVMSNVGDLITRDASNTTARIPVGGLGQVLTVQSDGTANWQDPTGGFSDPMTNAGDIIARDITNTTTRVGIGSVGQVLTVGSSGNEVLWQDAPGGGLAADVAANTANIATNTAAIAANTASIATNTVAVSANTVSIATNTANIAGNDTDIAGLQSDVVSLDSRVDALELVSGSTMLYDVESVTGVAPSGVGKFSVNSTDASLVTQIQMGALDKNGVVPATPVDGDTLLFIDPAGTGVEHRYVIDDASSGLSNMTVTNVLTSGDAWAVGVEYETYLFPTNKSAVVVGPTAPGAPELGAIWIDSGSLIWYAWTGSIWTPAHLPPSMETRISGIETQQATNVTNIATNTAEIQSNDADIAANAASIATNTADIATNTADIATNAAGIATNVTNIATNTANIATNAADIASNDFDIATNAANIATNTTDIAANTASITTNVANIATNTTDIATNTANIASNDTDIAANAATIATNVTDIASNTANIASNTANIAANSTAIITNVTDIAANAANIATNTSDIATNVTNIATNTSDITVLGLDVSTNQADIAANAANIATNTANIATNTTDIATNTADIASNDADISANTSAIGSLDARVDALELVTGATLLYDVENIAGAAPTGSGDFTVNSSDASLVTQIQMGALDKNGLLPSTPVDGDTLLFRDSANTGIEHRYLIDDASSGLADLTVTNVLTSGDAWAAGVEYETYLFPTNKSAVVVDVAAPLVPDVGAIWIDSGSLIWYAWTGAAWVPAHLPPSMETRISGIETQQAQNTTDIATNSAAIAINATEIANNDASISTNATAISTNTTNIAANAGDIATNAADITTISGTVTANIAAIATNTADIATNASAIATNTTDIATNAGDIATNTAEISTKISEADGDARYLQLAGGTLTGTVTSEQKFLVDAPRDPSIATNSFIIKGNLGGVESQSLLYDYRVPSGNSLDSKVVYKGPVIEDDEIATKKYVDDEIASIPPPTSNPYTFYTVSSTGATWYELINLRSNNTYEVLVELSSSGLSGSASLKVGADGTPSRNSFIELGTVVGTGNYKFRISDANTLDVEPLDSGTVNIRVTITGDASTTGGSDLVMSATASTATSNYVQTPNVDGLRGGGIFTTTSQTHVLDYSNSVQLANVADPTDGTMVGDRAYNDARYEPLGGGAAYVGGEWGSSSGPITLTDALTNTGWYRKVVAFQIFGGSHTDTPGWGATSGTSNTPINFATNMDKVGLQWDEGSSNNRTIFGINKSTITGSSNYTRNSNQILLVNNVSVTSNRVSANTGVFFTFEFFRGNGCGLGCGWTANVHAEYLNNDGRATATKAVISCNSINVSNMRDLVLWGQSGYSSFGRWHVVAAY